MTRTKGASGFTDLQAHLGTRTPRFDGTGKIALGRGMESGAVGPLHLKDSRY